MTNHWIDYRNSDVILIIGSNTAENHVISFKWITKAKENGATIINVDPRYTRTTSKADIYCPLRPGTDIPFIGGMINYILQNDLYQKEYVVEYTNASFLIDPNFKFEDGLFSGFNAEKHSYDKTTWSYQLDEQGVPKRDKTLQDPNCAFQLLKKHFSRYDVDTVCSVCGSPKDAYLKVVETFSASGKPEKSGMLLYAMGATQHTVGTQNIRSYTILQTLLGNMGIPGGGINAQR
ncbi:MAG: molybdopterin-dependent oxidoreductase, partial [Candidatus Omnitrophica bacterium]|nr:molybdopterin-dependent oxidoreductase [Candidatus Omnitrophota bacterium]